MKTSRLRRRRQASFVLAVPSLLLIGLILVVTPALLWQQPVKAVEVAGKAASSNSWQGASFPLENFQSYSSPFGYRVSPTGSSGWEFHGGLDLVAPPGSYIRNWWAGKVTKVADGDACGTQVVIQSGSWEHVYCHMQGHIETHDGRRVMIDRQGGVQVWQGQQIGSGSRIGRVGMTGRTTGPHLHWGLKYASQYVDPALVLRAMYAQQPSRSQSSNIQQQVVASSQKLQAQKQADLADY